MNPLEMLLVRILHQSAPWKPAVPAVRAIPRLVFKQWQGWVLLLLLRSFPFLCESLRPFCPEAVAHALKLHFAS